MFNTVILEGILDKPTKHSIAKGYVDVCLFELNVVDDDGEKSRPKIKAYGGLAMQINRLPAGSRLLVQGKYSDQECTSRSGYTYRQTFIKSENITIYSEASREYEDITMAHYHRPDNVRWEGYV